MSLFPVEMNLQVFERNLNSMVSEHLQGENLPLSDCKSGKIVGLVTTGKIT